LVGFFVLAALLFPGLLVTFMQDKEIGVFVFLNTLIITLLSWGFGALLGSLLTIVAIDRDVLNRQSIWAFVMTYAGYIAFDLGIAIILASPIMRAATRQPKFWPSKNHTFGLFIIPFVLASVPFLILHYTQAFHTEEYYQVGIYADSVRQAFGLIFVYLGTLLIYLSQVSKDPIKFGFSFRYGYGFVGAPSMLQSMKNGIISTSVCCVVFGVWFLGFNSVKSWRLIDFREKNYIYDAASIIPPATSPEGYKRYSDSDVKASVIFPENWTVKKESIDELISINAHDLSNYRTLDITSFPLSYVLTPEEQLRLYSRTLFSDQNGEYLYQQAEPITLTTKIGQSNGYSVEFVSPSVTFVQSVTES